MRLLPHMNLGDPFVDFHYDDSKQVYLTCLSDGYNGIEIHSKLQQA